MEAATRPGSPARLPKSASGGLPAPTLAKVLASPPPLSCLLLPRPLHPVLCSPCDPAGSSREEGGVGRGCVADETAQSGGGGLGRDGGQWVSREL